MDIFPYLFISVARFFKLTQHRAAKAKNRRTFTNRTGISHMSHMHFFTGVLFLFYSGLLHLINLSLFCPLFSRRNKGAQSTCCFFLQFVHNSKQRTIISNASPVENFVSFIQTNEWTTQIRASPTPVTTEPRKKNLRANAKSLWKTKFLLKVRRIAHW